MLNRRKFIKTGLIFIPTWYHTRGLGGSVSLSSLDNEVYNWMNRIRSGGSNYTSTSVVGQDYGMKRLRDFGLRSSILRLNWFCGLNATAALIPLIIDSGNTVDVTLKNAAGVPGSPSDWTYNETGSSGGLKALTANTFIDSSFASNNYTSIDNVGISIYVRDTTVEESFLAGSNTFGDASQFYLCAGYTITFTNTYFKFPGGIVPVPTTNANAVTILTFASSPFTAGQLYGGTPTLDVK